MSDTKSTLINKLQKLHLTADEAKIYIELLQGQSTHLRLSHVTGINRTKVYRVVETLEKRSLVSRRTDDTGTFLVASNPSALEITLVTEEESLKQQRNIFTDLLPSLDALTVNNSRAFVVRTYEGIEGLKQMCWHELQTRDELLSLGGQTIEDLITDHYWAEKHRKMTVEAGYSIREIINQDVDLPTFTNNPEFMKRYHYRQIHSKNIYFDEQINVYNDIVSIYHWREDQKVGVEIIGSLFANTMRQVFNHFWEITEKPTSASKTSKKD